MDLYKYMDLSAHGACPPQIAACSYIIIILILH